MSMMLCARCSKLVDTDRDDGEWRDTDYTCEACCESEDEEDLAGEVSP